MQQKMVDLSGSVSDTALTLEASSNQAHVLHASQISASLSASHLADTLAQMTTTTYDSFEKINASATQIARSLSPRNNLLELIRFMEVVLPLDPSTIAYLHHLPVFPAVSAVLNCLLYLFRSSFSALMSIALLLFSSRKYLILPKPNHDHEEAAVNRVVQTLPSSPSRHRTGIHRNPEIISREPRIRKSRVPDRLCNSNR
ncbi:hypothetical protein K438DRAFT_1832427 [Mycena galopus ATCC 62051]|nr:hypothetical protein K438DRAFT_1832427 [Mycena galopus ATCC 62051]